MSGVCFGGSGNQERHFTVACSTQAQIMSVCTRQAPCYTVTCIQNLKSLHHASLLLSQHLVVHELGLMFWMCSCSLDLSLCQGLCSWKVHFNPARICFWASNIPPDINRYLFFVVWEFVFVWMYSIILLSCCFWVSVSRQRNSSLF